MPITFEEVTAEVPAERPAPPEASGSEPQADAGGDATSERALRALALRTEREWRHCAD